MRKLFLFFLCAVTAIAARAQFSGSGNGTAADPYRIYTDIHLAQVANFLNQEGIVFELMKDVDLSSYIAENSPSQGWTPIGVAATPFKGVFKGNNHTISGLKINRSTVENIGLFGYTSGASITDLNVTATSIVGKNNVGTVVGTATNTTITGKITTVSGSVKGTNNVGAIVGNVSGSQISGFGVTAQSVEGTSYIGGLIGIMSGTTLKNCQIASKLKGTTYVGGIVGSITGGSISDCEKTGNVIATGTIVGGIAGYANGITAKSIKTEGNVSGTTSIGGSFGQIAGTTDLNSITSIGDINGIANVSGIVGELAKSSVVTFVSCFSKGKITNTGDYTGGIVGKSNGICINSMDDCSHFDDIKGKNYVGGLVGAILKIEAAAPSSLSTYEISTSEFNRNTIKATYKDEIVTGTTTPHKLNNCTAIGNIEGVNYVGGLVGESLYATAYTSKTVSKTHDCKNEYCGNLWINGSYTGSGSRYTITFDMKQYTKGISAISLENSYYSGKITASDYVGGLAGHKTSGDIINCYTYATIAGKANVGGIAGKLEGYSSTQHGVIKSSVANNASITASGSNVGRIYGSKGENVTIGVMASAQGNRALTQTSVMLCGVAQDVIDDEQNGTSVGPSMLKLKANYVSWGWDFDKNWNILETECFPYKKYQAAPPVIDSKLESQDTEVIGHSVNGGTVYMYYKDREAVSTVCDGNNWAFTTDALQSGAQVQLYADVDGMTPSYFTSAIVKYPGSGTEEDPYRIYTAEDLQGASNSGYYKLMNDIDLTAWINENSPEKGWPAIGRNSTVATYINGDGHKVSGLWINTTEGYNGLFSNYSAGYIKNLTVEVATGKSVKGGDYTGVLIGRMANGQIINCAVKGMAEGTIHTGGVVGYVENTEISSTSFDGTVKSSAASSYVGGIAGYDKEVTTTGSNARVTINATGNSSYVGGLYGKSAGGSISNSYANATINATGSSDYVGGLVGYCESAVSLSYSTGEVQATGANSYTGGLIGYAKSPVANSYSTATVKGTFYVAGLVGYTFSTIDKCYAKGDVTGARYGAGLVGQLDGAVAAVTSSVAANNILTLTDQAAWGCRVIGGFKNGCVEPTLGSNLALSTMQVSLNGVAQKKTDDNIEGVAKTEAELMSASTYLALDWDMSDAWSIDEGSIYPYLLWEVDINPIADISLDKTTAVLAVGNSLTLSVNIQPLSATNKRLTWTSSKPTVATVEDGVVTAIAVGETTITATTTDGSNLSASCKVTVVANQDEAIAELQTLVDQAQALYDNSTEGENIGQYASGSRATLLAAIKAVKAKISSTMSESDITECTTQITNAINAFKAQQVSAGEDTDITLYDDVLYVESAEAAAGQQVKLSIKMNNLVEAQGFQCDLYLPDGVTVVTDEDDFPLAELSQERTTTKKTDYFNAVMQSDGALRFLCNSTKGYAFMGNEGEVATVVVEIGADVDEGTLPIILRDIRISDKQSVDHKVAYVKTTLTVSSYTLGDANNDGEISVSDFTAIANHILGNTPANFVEKAADVNTDGDISVGDLTGVANLILYQSVTGAPRASRQRDGQVEAKELSLLDNAIYAEPVCAAAGSEIRIPVLMKNEMTVCGFQFDMELPEGVMPVLNDAGLATIQLSQERTTVRKTDYLKAVAREDGTLRVLCNSTRRGTFSGNNGEVVSLSLRVSPEMPAGEYELRIRNVHFSDIEAVDTVADGVVVVPVTISSPNALEMLGADVPDGKFCYDLYGRRVNAVKGDCVIVGGQKMMVK